MDNPLDAFWAVPAAELFGQLSTTPGGLAGDEARRRLERLGPNVLKPRKQAGEFVLFGLVSSVFDYATFGVLHLLGATAQQFRTGWFVESVVSASLIVLVIRTPKPFFRSRPSRSPAATRGAR